MRRPDGKSAPITGAARGPGRAFAEAYVREGKTVVAAEGLRPGDEKKQVGAAVPIGRMATADDPTGMAVFLASKEADHIVAQTHDVDGGNWMS